VSSVSNYLDPVEAVKDEVRRSKRVIASALDDLSQHHSWLESYHRDERRRAQRLRRKEALRALKMRRERATWIALRFAKTYFEMMQTTAVFLARNGAAFLAWATSRGRALALLLARETFAAIYWSWRTVRVLARKVYQGAAIGFAWTVRTSDALGIAFRKRLSTGAALLYAEAARRAQPVLQPALKRASTGWIRARSRSKRFALTLQSGLTNAWSRTRHELPILTRKGGESVINAFAWTVRTFDELGIAFRKRLSSGAALLYAEAEARAQTIAGTTLNRASTSWIRTLFQSKRFAYTLQTRASDSWSRTRGSATTVARDAVMATSQGCARLAENVVTINALGRERLSITFGWTWARLQHFTRSAFQPASKAWSRAALRSRTVLEGRGPQHRALIVRQCTALVCIERRRDRLPVVRAG